MLTISAVVPCYNGEPFLAEALESIRRQSRPVDEIIVVDDGSSDRSADIATEMGAMVIRQSNRGEGASRNRGIQAARGDVIAWLDADDVWHSEHIEVVAGLLEQHPGAAGAFGAVQRFGADTSRILGYVPTGEPGPVLVEAFRDWLHTTIGAVTRRTVLLDVGGFDENERYSVDFDLWLRLARSHTFVATHQVTSCWRWHPAQQSSAGELQLAAVYRYRRRFIDSLRADREDVLTEKLEHEMVSVWIRDMRTAIEQGNRPAVRALRVAARSIPALGMSERSLWTLLSRMPPGAVRGAASLRAMARRNV